MSTTPSSKGKNRAQEPSASSLEAAAAVVAENRARERDKHGRAALDPYEPTTFPRPYHPTTAADQDDPEERDTITQAKKLQQVLKEIINEGSSEGTQDEQRTNTKRRKLGDPTQKSKSSLQKLLDNINQPKIPKKILKPGHEGRASSVQGEALPTEITEQSFEPFPEDTITPKEKKQITICTRLRDLLGVVWSQAENMTQNLREYLEEFEGDLPENLIDIVESLQTLTKHVADAQKLTKDNLATVSKGILYDHMKINSEAQKLMSMVEACNSLDPDNKVSIDNLKSVKQLNETALSLMSPNTQGPITRSRAQHQTYAMHAPMVNGFAHPGGMVPMMMMSPPRGTGMGGAQWYAPGGPQLNMMGGGNTWRGVAPDQCRRCGMRGHFAAHCPTRAQSGPQPPPQAAGAPRIQMLPWYAPLTSTTPKNLTPQTYTRPLNPDGCLSHQKYPLLTTSLVHRTSTRAHRSSAGSRNRPFRPRSMLASRTGQTPGPI